MAVITIVTSAPPLTEGGHLVLARSLERALRDAGHRAGIVTTPSSTLAPAPSHTPSPT